MSQVKEHYDRLLSHHYTWMFGTSFEGKVEQEKSFLTGVLSRFKDVQAGGLAVDLGCGPGFQTIALAQLGFAPVVGIDTSANLLDELRSHAADLPIEVRQSDLRKLCTLVPPGQATVIVCMGDTLTHLPTEHDVTALFRAVFECLAPGGLFVITYRDLTKELSGTDRFIPVQSDDNKIMTCFLEFKSASSVTVHDLVYTRQPTGWSLEKSSYSKLRLGMDWVHERLQSAGFTSVALDLSGRLIAVSARAGASV
jgi:SAM-dependent methyltransferase